MTFSNFVKWFGDTIDIRNGDKNKPFIKSKFNPCDTLTINPGEYHLVKGSEPVKTTVGRLIFNKVLIESLHFENVFEYQNKVISAGDYGAFDGKIANALKEDLITVDQMVEYISTRDWFGLQLHGVITTSFTEKVLTVPDDVKKLKKELFEKYKKEIEQGDEHVTEKIENQLIDAIKKSLDGDLGMDLYNSGARGSVSNHLKNTMLTRGAIKNPVTNKYEIIQSSLMDGLEKKDITTHANMIVSGAFPKACGTAVSGYLAKQLLAALQSEVLGEKDSDCGSLRYIDIELTDSNFNDFLYRYVKTGKSLTMLTPENKDKFIGKKLEMRTPMYCIGYGPTKCLCNKCAGDFYYKLGKVNVGLVASKVSGTLTQLNLQKFHSNVVKTRQIDVDNIVL